MERSQSGASTDVDQASLYVNKLREVETAIMLLSSVLEATALEGIDTIEHFPADEIRQVIIYASNH
jgi:hypothetical protein